MAKGSRRNYASKSSSKPVVTIKTKILKSREVKHRKTIYTLDTKYTKHSTYWKWKILMKFLDDICLIAHINSYYIINLYLML